MNKDLRNGLLVAGVAVLAYLLYKEMNKKRDIVVVKNENLPAPIEVELPIESPVERPKPVESVLIDAPINI